METSGVHDNDDDDDENSYCLEVTTSSSLVEEYKSFGVIIYP